VRRVMAILVIVLMLAACGSVESTFIPFIEITPQPSERTASTTPIASAICDFFAAGGANDHFTDATVAAIDFAAGKIDDPSEAVATRDAIVGTEQLAAGLTGAEREDLLTLADVADKAALSGQGYAGWADALNAFYVKYAERCGQPIAS
jgi:hypothetical protein